MEVLAPSLVRQVHAASVRFVLAASGGGSRAIAELLEVPGASRTVLEAVVPYSEGAMIAWLGARPEHFCAPRTARAMAVAAFERARKYCAGDETAAGIACTASLASDRPKRGAHRAHVGLQTAQRTATWSLELQKGRRTREEEEQLVSRLVLNAVAEAAGIDVRLTLPLVEGERVEKWQTVAPQTWRELLLGKVEAVCEGGRADGSGDAAREGRTGDVEIGKLGTCPTEAVFPGAFNPLHVGHRRMAQIAKEMVGVDVALEMSIVNVDKPPLDYREIEDRLLQFPRQQAVWLTRAPTFVEKSRLFPGATFVVGTDTLRRIGDPRYYGRNATACLQALEEIADRGCRFLVFARDCGAGLVRLGDLDVPGVLRGQCQEVPPERFREDISSTALRTVQESDAGPN